jgi:uncharacterized protein (TIRG00374 family)
MHPTMATLGKLAISMVALAVVLATVDLRETWNMLTRAAIAPLSTGLALGVFMTWISAAKSTLLARQQAMKISLAEMTKIGFTSSFYGLFLPGPIAGGLVRWYKINRIERSPSDSFANIAMSRLVDIGVVLAIGFTATTLDSAVPQRLFLQSLFAAGTVAVFLTFWLGRKKRVVSWFDRLAENGVRPWLLHLLASIASVLRSTQRVQTRTLFKALGIELFAHFVGIVCYLSFSAALEIGVPILTIVWIRSLVLLFVMLPISVSGIGIREATLVGAFALVGVPTSAALGLGALLFLRRLVVGLIGGIIELFSPSRARVSSSST